MRQRFGVLALAVSLLGAAGMARAADTHTLALRDDSQKRTGFDGGADLVPVGRWYGNGGYYRAPRTSYYAPRYGYYAPRAYYPRYNYGFNYGYGFNFGFNYYRPWGFGFGFGYAPPVYSYTTPYWCPTGLGVDTYSLPTGNVTYSVTRPNANTAPPAYGAPYTAPPPQNGTYPYDGGPSNPVPMPRVDADPIATPRLFRMPTDVIPVSLPAKGGKYVYPAYGEEATRR